MKKKILIVLAILCIAGITLTGVLYMNKNKKQNINNDDEIKYVDNSFNLNLIKKVNFNKNENYLVSPYSVEIALNLLREGANGNTLTEIEKVIGKRTINDVSIKNRVSVANAAFVKDKYKESIKKEFYNDIKTKYNSEILYDEFTTPKVINDWVNDKTDGMIKEVLSNMNPNFILGLANALAIDVEWVSPFDCNNTQKEKFTKLDGTRYDTEMMHRTLKYDSYKYLKDDKAVGVVMPYKKYAKNTGEEVYEDGSELEFIAIIPNDNLHNYINNLTENDIENLYIEGKEVSSEFEINLSLPRFKYDYTLDNFKEILIDLGIKDAFDEENADFSNISDTEKIYVGEAIHKTHIDLNEKGTKAAAVTYFGMYTSGIPMKVESVDVIFNRPFLYMIRDTETKEILFFGTVYEPNKWIGRTCSEELEN